MQTLGVFVPALCAGLLWALSSLSISAGLRGLRSAGAAPYPAVAVGLLCSLTAGTVALFVANGAQFNVGWFDRNTILSGVLTFPIATGLYYLTAVAYQDRAEMSSQFANAKPAFSLGLAAIVFGEPFGALETTVTCIVGAGVLVILLGAGRGRGQIRAAALGLTLAASWAGGEAFARSAREAHSAREATFAALASSLVLCLVAIAVYAATARLFRLRTIDDLRPRRAHIAFVGHGVISFGAAYTLFFHSIGLIGLGRTVLITVWWPTLALAFGTLHARATGARLPVDRSMLVALALFTLASTSYVAVGAFA